MEENDWENNNLIWLISFIISDIIYQYFEGPYDYYFLKHNYDRMLHIDSIELVICLILIIISITFDYLKSKASDLAISKFYMKSSKLDDGMRLAFIFTLLICIYNFLQDIRNLKIINKMESTNIFGLSLIILVLYLRYLAIKVKKIQWEYLPKNTENVNWNYLIQNNYFDQYKGEVILFKLIKSLNLENAELQVSANNYFNFYKQFVDQLQAFSNKKLIELLNYLKMQNRETYRWTVQKVISANLGKVFLSILVSALSFSSIIQLCTSIKRDMVLNGMLSILNNFIFFYVLLFLIFYLLKIVIYSVFISYQRKIRNKNIELFLISTIQCVLDLRKNIQKR